MLPGRHTGECVKVGLAQMMQPTNMPLPLIVANVRFDCPQTFLSLDFQCRDDVFELK